MGMSLISALMIKGNEVQCVSMGPFDNGKYGGVIYMLKNGDIHTPIVSIDQGHYDTSKEVIEHLEEIVEAVRQADLSPQEKEIGKNMKKTASIIKKEKDND